ncbi:MAG: hypothetical protein LBU87_02505, partial [Lactobacillales bacterium]|jgi:hypothetical protein|nr:hypothetical protein [Lactobacillales bacterium]
MEEAEKLNDLKTVATITAYADDFDKALSLRPRFDDTSFKHMIDRILRDSSRPRQCDVVFAEEMKERFWNRPNTPYTQELHAFCTAPETIKIETAVRTR